MPITLRSRHELVAATFDALDQMSPIQRMVAAQVCFRNLLALNASMIDELEALGRRVDAARSTGA